jgi:hypothetical protein
VCGEEREGAWLRRPSAAEIRVRRSGYRIKFDTRTGRLGRGDKEPSIAANRQVTPITVAFHIPLPFFQLCALISGRSTGATGAIFGRDLKPRGTFCRDYTGYL